MALLPNSTATLRHSTRPAAAVRPGAIAAARRRPPRLAVGAAAAGAAAPSPSPSPSPPSPLVRELDLAIAALGPGLEGVLPGGDAGAKQRVMAAVAALESAAPFSADAPGAAAALLGEWDLVFASDGTVVTRTGPARALAALSPAGLGLRDIRQSLEGDAGAAAAGAGVACANSLTVGLGLLGTWQLSVSGRWLTTHRPSWCQSSAGGGGGGGGGNVDGISSGISSSGSTPSTSTGSSALDSEVVFDALGVRLVGLPGLGLADLKLPELRLPAPGGPRAPRAEPNWRTTFCDGAWRVGRGVGSKGVFVFRRRQDGA